MQPQTDEQRAAQILQGIGYKSSPTGDGTQSKSGFDRIDELMNAPKPEVISPGKAALNGALQGASVDQVEQVGEGVTKAAMNGIASGGDDAFSNYWNNLKDEFMGGAGMVKGGIEAGAKNLETANMDNAPMNGAMLAGNGLGSVAGVGRMILSPFTAAIKNIIGAASGIIGATDDFVNGSNGLQKSTKTPGTPQYAILQAQDAMTKFMNDFSQKHPDAATALTNGIGGILTMLTSGEQDLGGMFGNAKELAGMTGTAAKESASAAGTAAQDALGSVKPSVAAAKENITAIKEKVMPTPTVDELVGKVAQGSTGDIPSFTKGLENIGDTSKIKTYEDLNTSAKSSITKNAKAQDLNLGKDTTSHNLEDFTQTTGEGSAAVKTNYVKQAIDQLSEFYTKTNDAEGLSKIKAIEEKAKTDGLTVLDVNNLARLHGQDLSGFNANGELASGLTKQAAENTRAGMKTTIENNISDPEIKNNFRAIDQKMSDTYTVKDLSSKMTEKVNTLKQRLQKPNILQKIGGLAGKIGRSTGVGDFAQKLLGLEKTPGATTLNALELEAKLSKNLKKIDALMSKDDKGFIEGITELLNQSE